MKYSFAAKFFIVTIINTSIVLLFPLLIAAQNPNSQVFFDSNKIELTDTPVNSTVANIDPNKSVTSNDIVDIRITGNVQNSATDILKIIKTKINRPFNAGTIEEDKRALMNTGLFIDVKLKVEKIPAGYIVTFIFYERPIIHYIRFIGNHAHTRKTLLEEINIRVKESIDPIAIHQAKERLENFYREGGYHNVFVEVLSGDKVGDRGVVFNISEGTQQKILGVTVEGSKTVSGEHLKTLLQSKRGILWSFGGEFSRKKLEEDVETLIAYYRKLGFFYAKVDREFTETDGGYSGLGKSRRWVKIKFIVDEGPRCLVRDIKFVGQKSFSDTDLRKVMQLSREKYFNQDLLETDIAKIREKYGEIGHVFASVEPDPRIDDNLVDVVINIDERQKCYLRGVQVEILGHEGADPYTKWYTVLNRLSIHPGEILNTKEIESSKRRLMASGLFISNPMQGQMPEITFSVPEELNKENELQNEEMVVADGPVIRGQIHKLIGLHDNTKNKKILQTRFLNKIDKNLAPQNLRPIENRPQYQQPPHRQSNQNFYIPEQKTVQPLNLSLKKFDKNGNENLYSAQPDDVTFRGQYTPLAQPTNQDYANPNYGNSNYGNQSYADNYAEPSQLNSYQVNSPQPAQTSRLTFVQPSIAPVNLANNVNSGVALINGQQTQYQPPTNFQPAPILPTQYSIQPTQYRPPASETTPQNNTANNEKPYATSTLNLSEFNAMGTDKQDIYLGNNNSDAEISRSAYAIDPNNTYRDKIYPSDMVVKVQETRTGMIMMSLAVSSDTGLMGRFMIEEQNFDILNFPKGMRLQDWKNAFRGKGQRFRIEAMPGTDVSRYSASWETPYLFNLDYSFGVNGFYYQRFYDEWYEDRTGGSISFGKLWTPDFLTSLTLGGQDVRIYNASVPSLDLFKAVGRHPMYTVGISARHNTRDSEYRPTQGHLISFGVEQVLGDYQFVRGNVDIRKYFTMHERPDRSGRWVLGLRCSLDVSETGTPIFERYFGGGYSSLRGFEYRGVSPRNLAEVAEGGCMEFYNSAELIFPITADDMVMGSIFIDTGTVEKSIHKWEDDYRVSVGFGLYLTIPMMGPAPIALNFGFPINKSPLDEKQIFAFTMGWQR
ncbi:MAG: BamA/TamA family outer membrane protein [Planctomycetaceae bacterium]|jgi:outer membrane protein insertion porin family|nr:BamA/TamA family outer membrane protein [Planctomycetaceae bacterium]